MKPCECCDYPFSHKHHLLLRSEWGENDATARLCPNCHHLVHLIYNHLNGTKSNRDLGTLILKLGLHSQAVTKAWSIAVMMRQVSITISQALVQKVEENDNATRSV